MNRKVDLPLTAAHARAGRPAGRVSTLCVAALSFCLVPPARAVAQDSTQQGIEHILRRMSENIARQPRLECLEHIEDWPPRKGFPRMDFSWVGIQVAMSTPTFSCYDWIPGSG